MHLKLFLLRQLFVALPVILAAILHMIIVKFDLLAYLKYPIDFKKSFRDKRIFGDNKTFRGIIVMILFSMFFCAALKHFLFHFPSLNQYYVYDFTRYSPLLYGLILGLGYTLFELPNSFIKRQSEINSGKRGNILNILADQADSVIGCFLLLYPFANFNVKFLIAGVILFTAVHLFFNFTLWVLGVRENPL